MATDWSSDALRKMCFAKEEDPTFKLYYRGQMIGLIRKIILATCDPNHDCTGDTKRETNLKNEMEIVRKDDLTMFLISRESTCLTARKMLDVMSEYEDDMDRSQNTDLCVLLIVKNCDYMTCEIVVSLIDFIFEKKHVCLQRFSFLARLFWLNCTFNVYSNVVEIKDCLNVIFSDFIKMYLKHLNVAPTFIRNNL